MSGLYSPHAVRQAVEAHAHCSDAVKLMAGRDPPLVCNINVYY